MQIGASEDFLELVAICKGDSFDESNNCTHAEAVARARNIVNSKNKKNMNIIKGIIKTPQKIVLYGESGVGKTTLGAQFENPIIIDAERSSTHIDTPRVFVDTWQDVGTVLSELLGPQGAPFATVIIDTVDWVEMKCAEFICAKWKKGGIEEFGYGKGYTYLEEEFRNFLRKCDELIRVGKNVVLLAHQTLRKIEPPDEGVAFDRYEPKLSKKINPVVVEWCDALLFMYRKTYVEQKENGKGHATGGKKRVICANSASFCLAKSRLKLPDEFDADVSVILPLLGGKATTPAKAETAKPAANVAKPQEAPKAERTAVDKLRDLLALGQFSEGEMLTYLYGKNKRGTAFVEMGTEFNDIPAKLIEQMIEPQNWERIEATLTENRK